VITDDIAAFLRAAGRVAAGEDLTGELLGEEGVPVALRLLLAAAVLAAADRPVTKKSITTVAPAARSASYRDHAEILEEVCSHVPALVQAQLRVAADGPSVTDLSRQLQDAHRRIESERARRQEAESQLQHVISYARELHWKLKGEYDAIIREKTEKVRPLRPLPSNEEDTDTDA
jgi:hypothetical protein